MTVTPASVATLAPRNFSAHARLLQELLPGSEELPAINRLVPKRRAVK